MLYNFSQDEICEELTGNGSGAGTKESLSINQVFDTDLVPDAQFIKIGYQGPYHVNYSLPDKNNVYYDFYRSVKEKAFYSAYDGGGELKEFLREGYVFSNSGPEKDPAKIAETFDANWSNIASGALIVTVEKKDSGYFVNLREANNK